MLTRVGKSELFQAQAGLIVAIFLQYLVWRVNHNVSQAQFVIILVELALLLLVSFSSAVRTFKSRSLHRLSAVLLLLLMSVANVSSLIVVVQSLISNNYHGSGLQLLSSALAIFATNVIVFSLWYWEIDSPGLTNRRWSTREKDFQFIQQDLETQYKSWKPEFFDYLYLSITNALNFAAADARPLTKSAKALMSLQALISVFTLALVLARSVSILG